jgi:hypothetical protein
MNLPPLQGNLTQSDFFIYAAADSVYFETHGKPLINSVIKNTSIGIHLHIYDPTEQQLKFCTDLPRVSFTYEYTNPVDFQLATDYWSNRTEFTNDRQRQMFKKGQVRGQDELNKLIRQTYYACMRFVRLAEILPRGQRCLSIDVDGLVRAPFEYALPGDCDFFLYEKPKDGTHLAGAVLFNGTDGADNFLREYANQLRTSINENDLYWFLDQLVLDQIVPKYCKGLLPMSYIDWAMRAESPIWSAKGPRKELDIFKNEQRKYA